MRILDMRQVANFCDYFVILSGTSLRHVNAVAQAIDEDLAKDKVKRFSLRALSEDASGWIVLDYSSVICHIFYKPTRELYALEKLWSDAKRVRVQKSLLSPK